MRNVGEYNKLGLRNKGKNLKRRRRIQKRILKILNTFVEVRITISLDKCRLRENVIVICTKKLIVWLLKCMTRMYYKVAV
ncbi:Uncharacterized protein TCM_044094 [Theobroma cacao]|uniref:Uncharacterized protein n=1 Tax=Theobroma cacao TaxID=3641 RepID=A0A061FQ76_THECC|nr:Uncharacterized protein TCM_044094 [Theobroma cacao]